MIPTSSSALSSSSHFVPFLMIFPPFFRCAQAALRTDNDRIFVDVIRARYMTIDETLYPLIEANAAFYSDTARAMKDVAVFGSSVCSTRWRRRYRFLIVFYYCFHVISMFTHLGNSPPLRFCCCVCELVCIFAIDVQCGRQFGPLSPLAGGGADGSGGI